MQLAGKIVLVCMIQVNKLPESLVSSFSRKGFGFAVSLLASLLMSAAVSAAVLEGEVSKVSDGDTITVISKGQRYRIRFLGIDAPESNQKYGAQSRNHLASEIRAAKNRVTVEYNEKDRYGRIVGKVLANGKDLNFDQVKTGNAWVYVQYEKKLGIKDRIKYRTAQSQAQDRRIGLWAEKNPTPPWEYRKAHKKSAKLNNRF